MVTSVAILAQDLSAQKMSGPRPYARSAPGGPERWRDSGDRGWGSGGDWIAAGWEGASWSGGWRQGSAPATPCTKVFPTNLEFVYPRMADNRGAQMAGVSVSQCAGSSGLLTIQKRDKNPALNREVLGAKMRARNENQLPVARDQN